jgi:hypothetical protein
MRMGSPLLHQYNGGFVNMTNSVSLLTCYHGRRAEHVCETLRPNHVSTGRNASKRTERSARLLDLLQESDLQDDA